MLTPTNLTLLGLNSNLTGHGALGSTSLSTLPRAVLPSLPEVPLGCKARWVVGWRLAHYRPTARPQTKGKMELGRPDLLEAFVPAKILHLFSPE